MTKNMKIAMLATGMVVTCGVIANAEIEKMQEITTLEHKVDSIEHIPGICFDDTIAEMDCYIDFCEACEANDADKARKAYKEIEEMADYIVNYNEE